jgi:hypothetical protein
MHLTKRFSAILCTGVLFLTACVGTAPQGNVPTEPAEASKSADFTSPAEPQTAPQPASQKTPQTAPQEASSESSVASAENTETFAPVAPANEPMTPESEPMAPANEVPDIYVEIPRLAQMALTRADSFYAAGNLDSAAAIVERFSVLNPLWKEWQFQAKSIGEKVRSGYSKKDADLQQLLIAMVNANSRRAPYAEVKVLADTICASAPSDSIRRIADSLSHIAYARTFEKVKLGRDEALTLAREKAAFDAAEQKLSDLILRYSDFVDTLKLQRALLQISSLRMEESSASAEYWKSHDPKKSLEEAKQLSANKKWSAAKEMLLKLKSSSLRGEALRELDSVYVGYCTEKRKRTATLFAESKNKKANKADKISKAIAELDACLEFAPDYKDRATVLSNKQFLQSELSK